MHLCSGRPMRPCRRRPCFTARCMAPATFTWVLLLAALLCWKEGAPEEMVRQVFRAASYHDVGRTFDGYDIYHGARSALRLRR